MYCYLYGTAGKSVLRLVGLLLGLLLVLLLRARGAGAELVSPTIGCSVLPVLVSSIIGRSGLPLLVLKLRLRLVLVSPFIGRSGLPLVMALVLKLLPVVARLIGGVLTVSTVLILCVSTLAHSYLVSVVVAVLIVVTIIDAVVLAVPWSTGRFVAVAVFHVRVFLTNLADRHRIVAVYKIFN